MPPILLFALLLLPQDSQPDPAVLRLKGHPDGVRSVAWSPDGKTLLTGSRDRTIAFWDTETGQQLRMIEGHAGGVTSVAFSPDGKQAVSGSQDKTVALWDVRTGKLVHQLKGHSLWVTSVAFSPDGHSVLSGSLDRTAILWDARDGSFVAKLEGHVDRLQEVAFSPDGKEALTASADRTVLVWDLAKRARADRYSGEDAVACAAFSPSGREILAGCWNGLVYRWDRSGQEEPRTFKGHTGTVLGIAVAPDGLVYASSGRDGSAIVGDARSGKRLKRFFGPECQLGSLAWSPGGRRLAIGAEDGTVLIWEPWRPTAAARDEWTRTWGELSAEARRDAVRSRLRSLKDADAASLADVREWLVQAGDEAVSPMLDLFQPGMVGTEPSPEQQKKFLADLDSEDFAARTEARKAILAFGPGALPWIDQKLRRETELSAEVRSALGDLRLALKSQKGREATDDGRTRAIRILLELPRSTGVREALRKYSEGPEESPATRAARPAASP